MIDPVAVVSQFTTTESDWVISGAAGILLLQETTAPSATANYGKVYVKSSDSKLYFMTDGGVEYDLTAAGAGANTALSNLAAVAINTTLVSDTDNTDSLGTAAISWSDLFLGSGAVITFSTAPSTADVTITHSSNTLTIAGGDLALGANNLTMTGSIAATGARVTKGWFTDLESTNMPTVGGTAILTSLTAPQFTTIELGHASDTTLSRSSAGVLAVEGVAVVLSSRSLTAGNGLTGGGDLSADRTFTVGAGTGITVNADDVAVNQATAFAWTGAHTHTVAGLVYTMTNTTDGASVQVAILEGDRATMADSDEAYLSLRLSNDGGTQTEFARLTWVATDVNVGTSEDGRIDFAVMTAGSLADEMQLDGSALSPSTNDGLMLGTTSLGWSDLHLATGGVINWANGEVTITETDANTLTVAGATAVSLGTSAAFTTGTIELGAASDTTLARSGAGVVTIEGVQILTVAGGTLTGSITLGENTAIALDPAGSADGKYNGITIAGTAGYAQTYGDLVYLDPTDSRWEKCDANSASGADGDSRGIIGIVVVAGAADGNACTILLHGVIRADAAFPAFTINNPVYVSETAGAVTQTQPTTTDVVIRIVGFALTADEMYFNPENDYITHT